MSAPTHIAACRAGVALASPIPAPIRLPPLRHSDLDYGWCPSVENSYTGREYAGTLSNAIGAFVDIEYFSVKHLNGSVPASIVSWKKVKTLSLQGNKFHGVLPPLNYAAMTRCRLIPPPVFGNFYGNYFNCPFPPGVTEKCKMYNGYMELEPVTNADCKNTTALE